MWIRKIFFILLGISYLVLGVFVFYRNIIPAPWNLVFGIACIVYGIWRVYRGMQMKQMYMDEEDK